MRPRHVCAAAAVAAAPADGPAGDSAIVIADSSARILNQNDSRPRDADEFRDLGPYDGHFTQFSGAIWYPMVYDFEDAEKELLGRRKRADQETRALAYIRDADAAFVFPCAGPPCFLDDSLFNLNDLDSIRFGVSKGTTKVAKATIGLPLGVSHDSS